MPTAPIIFTHTGKLGDFVYSLPVAAWYFKQYQRKIHWVLPKVFEPFHWIEKLLRFQEMTADFHLADFPIVNFECGGQPYKFNPAEYGYPGDYINLGLPSYPGPTVTEFLAKSAGLNYDHDFVLELGDVEPNGKCFGTEQRQSREASLAHGGEIIPIPCDLLELCRLLKGAKERHCWCSGIAVLLYMARIPFDLYHHQGNNVETYFPKNHFGSHLINYHLCHD